MSESDEDLFQSDHESNAVLIEEAMNRVYETTIVEGEIAAKRGLAVRALDDLYHAITAELDGDACLVEKHEPRCGCPGPLRLQDLGLTQGAFVPMWSHHRSETNYVPPIEEEQGYAQDWSFWSSLKLILALAGVGMVSFVFGHCVAWAF